MKFEAVRTRISSTDILPCLLVALTLAVYLPGFTWGTPHPTGGDRTHAWGNDDAAPLAPLAEMHNTFVVAKPDRNVAYPWFYYFLLACAQGPYLLYLLLTGGLANPSPVYPYGFADPVSAFRHLTWAVRSVSLLLGVAAVLGAFYTGKHLWNRRVGFLAAAFTLLMFPMAYYARVSNPDMQVLGWTSLGLAVCAVCLRRGLTVQRGIWLGVFMALAASTKDQAVASFLLLLPALLWLHIRSGKVDRLRGWTSVWAAPAAASASLAVVYVLASGIPIDPARYGQHLEKVLFATTSRSLSIRHPATPSGFATQSVDVLYYLLDVMSWPLLIAAICGVVMTIRSDRRSLWMLLSSVGFFAVLLPVGLSRLHYLLPVALPLNAFAAYGFERLLRKRPPVRYVGLAALLGTTGLLFLQTVDLTHDMVYDSRYEAGQWFARKTQQGDRVLYFGFGLKLPHLPFGIETIHVFDRADARPIILERRPDFILTIPQDINEQRRRMQWRYGPNSVYSTIPASLWRELGDGTLEYRLVAQYQTPRLFPWLPRPFLSYPTVNPPVHIFARADRAAGAADLTPWETAPHNPPYRGSREITVEQLSALPYRAPSRLNEGIPTALE